MFTYAIAIAVNTGTFNDHYIVTAILGWVGIKTKITDSALIEDVCAGTIVYDDLQPYYDHLTPLNDIHGIGAVLLPDIEVDFIKK